MECKVRCILDYRHDHSRFNRNIVECKEGISAKVSTTDFVLIETLWNVKKINQYRLKIENMVLIETLWNVKVVDIGIFVPSRYCFNRNIVECKEFYICIVLINQFVLIETLWNVKEAFDPAGDDEDSF